MNVIGFSGYSGAGKTTLVEKLIVELRAQGARVAVLKHAHHRFDIDHTGKDTWRYRQSGAFETLIASRHRLALMREFERETELTVHHLIAELSGQADWVLVEGFRDSDLPRIEVWRAEIGQRAWYPTDGFIVAIATDAPERLPVPAPARCPVLALDDPKAVAGWLLHNQQRFVYTRRP